MRCAAFFLDAMKTLFPTQRFALLCAIAALFPVAAQSKTLCTVMADAATGKVLTEQGDCRTRVTPASTFKIPLAVMGFDAGILQDARAPTWPFREGYADWGGDNWKQPTDPARWMKYSVVWYSRVITHQLGAQRLEKYAKDFGFGNADFSGDPGQGNGLDRAWIISSLKISPVEQVAFLSRLVNRQLPVAPHVYDKVAQVVEASALADGLRVQGKTGMAYPRKADGSFDEARAYGWFVGWASKDGRTWVFARLIQDDRKEAGTAGNRARDAFLQELPALLSGRAP
jgi:beta-lactamase class D